MKPRPNPKNIPAATEKGESGSEQRPARAIIPEKSAKPHPPRWTKNSCEEASHAVNSFIAAN
jgi:hypothetical protein